MKGQDIIDFVYLVSCSLNGKAPTDSRIAAMDFEALYEIGQAQGLTACIAAAIEMCGEINLQSLHKIKQVKEKSVRKNVLLNAERNQLQNFMDSKGIWHMPLKGAVLQYLYPKFGMRQMADVDILYDGTRQNELTAYMKNCGYTVQTLDKKNQAVYVKPPIYNFEMHSELFGPADGKTLLEYYSNIKSKLIPVHGKSCEYRMSDDDFYIYITAHSYKHFKSCGTGLRTLTDIYVYLKKKGAYLNTDYIYSELDKLGIADYEMLCRSLAQKLFSEDNTFAMSELSQNESELIKLFVFSGTYGNGTIYVRNRLAAIAPNGGNSSLLKLKYFGKRIFLPLNEIENTYPFYYRHKPLIPFLWIYRICRAFFFQRSKLKSELSALNSELGK